MAAALSYVSKQGEESEKAAICPTGIEWEIMCTSQNVVNFLILVKE